jgi:thiamine-monophosphate kinase
LKSIEELGERRIIDIILQQLEPMPYMPVPFGDDVSAFEVGSSDRLVVVKTDMLVGKTDVPPGMSLWQASRKAVVMNISDMVAKGVRPIGLLVSLGLPAGLIEKDVEQIGSGLNAGAREYDSYVLGGDTSESSDLIISCSAFGACRKDSLMLRSGAQPGDAVAVTGPFGNTAAGLKILKENLSVPKRLKETLINSVFMPHARLNEGLTLAQTGAVTASIDSSDGLAWSLHEISKTSNVGFIIDELPIAQETIRFAELLDLDPTGLCLYGGEEYEIIVTIKPELLEKARKKVPLMKIGRVTKELALILKTAGKKIQIEARGWEHFRSSGEKP